MSNLPKISAYKSSITFGEDGVTIKDDDRSSRKNQNMNYQGSPN